MVPPHFYYQLVVLGLLWLCVMLHLAWASPGTTPQTKSSAPLTPRRKHSTDPKPFAGLTHKPHCALGEQEAAPPHASPPAPPEPMPPTNRRPRAIDTSRHFCPHPGCRYRGWPGRGNLRANGHPNGGPWRQCQCTACDGYFPEHHGTLFHGKRVPAELIVRVLACLAAGLGIRAMARVFEMDPNTVLGWLIEAADQLTAFTRYFLCAEQAIKRLERSRHWVWTAIDPESKLLLAIEVGPRTLEMAQRMVHRVAQRVAPGCVPAWFSDGFKGYLPAILGHCGWWVHPARHQDKGPWPKPRWMPLPGLLYAQVVKQYRRKRVVGVQHRVVFGTREAIEPVLAACGWQSNPSFVERLNLDIRQRVAAVGRRGNMVCQGEDGLQQQLAVFHAYHNLVVSHTRLRQPLRVPEPTKGTGSAKRWRPA